MSAAKFEFNLSVESISKLVNELKKFETQLYEARTDILIELSKYALEKVRENIKKSVSEFSTGQLESSIQIEQVSKDIAKVYTDLAYAKFVEFGTGITGKNNPHPKANDEGWKYDVNNHGEYGWYYYKDNQRFWTKGLEPHKFMENALKDIENNYMDIVIKVLKQKGIIN